MLRIDSLTKRYKDKVAVRTLSFQFDQGLLGLLGPNGAGKTTLMKCIASLIEYEGSITLDGRPISSVHIGYLPQKFNFFPNLKVKEAVEYAAIMKNEHRTLDIEDLLSKVNLLLEENKLVRNLSGGMLRRLGIAFALLGSPDLIIVDEPTAGLDPLERLSFTALIKEISRKIPVVVSTHIVEDIEHTADVVAVMNKGRIVHSGSLKQLKEAVAPRLYHVPSGTAAEDLHWVIAIDNDPMQDQALQRVLFQNEPLRINSSWRPAPPSIQDVYFDAVRNEAINGPAD